ncbi:uncharacterized protein A4U43_C01F9730 [Asparagus officinalis]|uniref:Late embryogenesis abundant protein LEA-2 subgroup domain-containing protein n=1 Tax=Asparagus officinalis TaxID=4686 RepID=A0A5P1FNZ6_ASPOF|nr:uncharacterized protein A4U43_C01F9730 [Asparagus officinalis]
MPTVRRAPGAPDQDPPRSTRARVTCFLFSYAGCLLLLALAITVVGLVVLVANSSLPLFYLRSFPVVVAEPNATSGFPVSVNIRNSNVFDFRITGGGCDVSYAGRVVGNGVLSPVELGLLDGVDVKVPVSVRDDGGDVHQRLREAADRGAAFDVEMKVEAKVGISFLKFRAKDFYVSCRVRVDSLRGDSKLTHSDCSSHY